MTQQKQGMTREEANQLYDSLKSAMESRYGKKGLESLIEKDKKEKASQVKSVPSKPKIDLASLNKVKASLNQGKNTSPSSVKFSTRRIGQGQKNAMLAIVGVGVLKLILGAVAATGLIDGGEVSASMAQLPPISMINTPTYSEDEIVILKSLDERRVSLEERSKKLDNREDELEKKDREFAARLTQLRELTNQLKIEREKSDKKQSSQLNQLASVYSSMGPKEAAQLLEQLDITISLALIERMPEKRMAQILSLMTPERALSLTQMLSKRGSI